MFGHGFAFNNAGYLLLLAAIPFLWWIGLKSLSGIGRWRRFFVVALRSLVIVLLVCALADMQYQRRSDRLTVLYVLDQSLSIPERQRVAMLEYVNASIERQRDARRNDRVGVIVFARNAEVELPPVDFDARLRSNVESILDPEYTDLASAIQRAQAMFPHDAAKRIVVVTDGNENMGDALQQARSATDAGVSIDVVPIQIDAHGDVSVERVVLPADVRKGQPFDARIVVHNAADPNSADSRPAKGTSRFIRKGGEREEIIAETPVTVPPGKQVFRIREEIDTPDFYTYEARYVPDDPSTDALVQNNLATDFTHVQGQGHVLLIEDWENQGDFDFLVARLRSENIQITVRPSNQLFTSLPELQRYDSVILANVPRSSGSDGANVSNFTNDQIDMLVRNTRELGCGLVMMGGRNSFGAGGWTNTELEKAMPVDFQIKSAKIAPVGALVLMMHGGEIPRANFWQKKVAIESIRALGERDYCGLVEWSGRDRWLWGQSRGGLVRVGPNRARMLSLVDRLTIGDMPQFGPAMKMAAQAFTRVKDAAVKHMIIISDGDPSPPSAAIIRDLVQQNVTVTTVDVAQPQHAPGGALLLQRIARQTGGKYYAIASASALPRIYQREVRRIARPLVYEPKPPVSPIVTTDHEIVQGIAGEVPPISGFVLTTVKDSPLVEVILTSPLPTDARNATVLAGWTYGLGKAVALTTDAGHRWANQWTGWDGYDKLFSQIVRWSMRPTGDTGNFTVATDVRDGTTRVVITALDAQDEFLNFQTMNGNVLRPDGTSQSLDIQQVAPGRYVATFKSDVSGSYMLNITPAGGKSMIRKGINVGYSNEFRPEETNLALLESMANLPAKGGQAGQLTQALAAGADLDELLDSNPFRRDLPDAVANQDIWPTLVMLASCLFFADVFVRRVQIHFNWIPDTWNWVAARVLGRSGPIEAEATIERLRSKKAEVDRELAGRQHAVRFTPSGEQGVADKTLEDFAAPSSSRPNKPAAAPTEDPAVDDQESYTSRLLKAKRQVWQDRDQDSS